MKSVVIGGLGLDITGRAKNKLIMKDSNPGEIRVSLGCVAGNIARNLFSLGEDVKLVSVVANDFNGKVAIEKLKNFGMRTDGIKTVNGDTATYLAVFDENADMKVAIAGMDIIEKIDEDFLKEHENALSQAVCIATETNLAEKTLERLFYTFEKKFFVDSVSVTKAKKLKHLLSNIYFLKTNVLESAAILDEKIEREADILKAGSLFIQKGVKNAAITCGEKGAYFFSSSEAFFISSEKVSVINTSGAGDAFLSGFMKGDLLDLPTEEKLKSAMAASLLTIKSEHSVAENLNMENIEKEKENICLRRL